MHAGNAVITRGSRRPDAKSEPLMLDDELVTAAATDRAITEGGHPITCVSLRDVGSLNIRDGIGSNPWPSSGVQLLDPARAFGAAACLVPEL